MDTAQAPAWLTSQLFLTEIHHFLWSDIRENRGVVDLGWNCRDHCATVGALLALTGIRSSIVTGRCIFVVGPDQGLPPVGIEQRERGGHSWLYIENLGIVDISPKLARNAAVGWRGVSSPGVVGNQLENQPTAIVHRVTTREDYDNEAALATYAEGVVTAVYLEERRTAFSPTMLTNARSEINSPLTDQLWNRFKPDVYLRLVAHLDGVLSGNHRTLASVSRWKAWGFVATMNADLDDLTRRLQLASSHIAQEGPAVAEPS